MPQNPTPKLLGELSHIKQHLRANNISALTQILNDWLQHEFLTISHPWQANISTQCVLSEVLMDANLLYFTDKDHGSQWVAVQVFNCIDFIYCYQRDEFFAISSKVLGHKKRDALTERIKSKDLSQLPRNRKLGGVLINHSRPAHFFFDQAINLASLEFPANKHVAHLPQTFFNVAALIQGRAEVKELQSCGEVYFLPMCSTGRGAGFAEMRQAILDFSTETPLSQFDHDYVLWAGVAGEKRKLANQVNVFHGFAQQLGSHYKSVGIVVDGYTAFDGERISNPVDEAILTKIRDKCANLSNVTFHSVIGADYYTKVCFAKQCDAFMTYAGTQLTVPLKICGLPGIIHSNRNYRLPGDTTLAKDVAYIDAKFVEELASEFGGQSDYVSYRINWRQIYNAFTSLLGDPAKKSP